MMPNLAETGDLDLMAAGLVSLSCIERDGPVLAPAMSCMFLSPATDFKIATLHDWSVPFLARDFDDEGESIWSEVQECYVCRSVRRPRFGPYLGVCRVLEPA